MKRIVLAMATLLALCLSSVAARADVVTLTLANPNQIVPDTGGTLMFEATLKNTGTTRVFLNGDNFNVADPLVLDDSDFLLNFPLYLEAGEAFTGNLFTVTVPEVPVFSRYVGFFSIVGGADAGAQDVLGTVGFAVTAVPEPASVLLVLAAMAVGCVGFRGTLRGARAMPE